VKNFIPAFALFLLWTVIGYFWLSPSTANSSEVAISPLDTITFPPAGTLKLGVYDYPSGISIFQKNTDIAIPENIKDFKDSIFNKLNAEQETAVLITGKYTQKIVDSLSTGKQGLLRAEALKKQLVAFGINPLKIETSSKEALFKYENGAFSNGIELDYQKINDLEKFKADIFKMHRFNYTKGKGIELNPQLTRFIYELKYYLAQNPNKKAELLVFTDSDGRRDKNYWDGLDTAAAFRKLLYKEYGFKRRQLVAASKGELEPLVDNNSDKKAQNNRIEITIK